MVGTTELDGISIDNGDQKGTGASIEEISKRITLSFQGISFPKYRRKNPSVTKADQSSDDEPSFDTPSSL